MPAILRIFADELDEVLATETSGLEAASQIFFVMFHVSPTAHSQFGAVLPDSKQAVQDLLQLEEQVLHP